MAYDHLERCALRRLSLELLSMPKPRVYELDGGAYVSSGVAPLDAGVLTEMVDDEGQCRDCRYRLYCG